MADDKFILRLHCSKLSNHSTAFMDNVYLTVILRDPDYNMMNNMVKKQLFTNMFEGLANLLQIFNCAVSCQQIKTHEI